MFKIISILVLLSSSRSWASDGPLVQLASRGLATAPKIHVNVNMVLVPVSVMDIYGRSVIGLQRESFAVFDDSHRVPIVSFARQDQHVTVGLIFDCSSSMQEKFGTAREAPRQLFQQFFTAPRGRTSLLDGVYAGLQHIRTSRNPRKALIIVSDGGDNNSRYTLRELSNMALESDAQIFAAGLYDRPQTEEEKDGPVLLSELCQRTGGANFVIKDRYGLRDAMGKIGVTLHNQYVLGYYPPDEGVDGKYRRIKVQLLVPAGVRPLHVNARTSYHVPEQ
jgi:Ca-activated chloride channel family protein